MSLQLYRSTVEDCVNKLAEDREIKPHEAFLRWIFYLVTGLGYDELEPEDLIDGHGEYQIDALHIDTSNSEQVVVTIIQVTFSESLSSTKLIKLHAGLDYLFQQPKAEYATLSNLLLRDKIQEFRDVRIEVLSSNIRVQCYYACLGDPSKATGEFPEQVSRIKSDYHAAAGEFIFEVLGPNEIYNLLNLRESKGAKVNERLKIIYDRNKANLLEHSIGDASGVICTVTAGEIARIVNTYPTVFDENLRRFLGFSRGSVNQDIRDSCTSDESAPLFWFLNNGITIVCDYFEPLKDFEEPFIEIQNLRIVNGCQTSTTLAKAQASGHLQPSTKVMVRVFKTRSTDLSSRLVLTTNNQNKITSRDLRARDEIQEHIKVEFERRFGLWYERTSNEFADKAKYNPQLVVSNQKIGQAYLAIVKRRPSDGGRRRYKVWGEHYKSIFNENVFPETYLLVHKIAGGCTALKRETLKDLQETDIRRIIVANGVYHIARTVSFLWRKGDDWSDLERLRQDLQRLNDEPELLKLYFEQSVELLMRIFQKDVQFTQEPSVALKSAALDEKIDTELYLTLAQARGKKSKKK